VKQRQRKERLKVYKAQAQTCASLLPYAKDGNANAKACLGHAYHKGRGVRRDIKKAIQFYKEAATDQKNPSIPAMYNLATIYLQKSKSIEDSIRWLKAAASRELKEIEKKDPEIYDAHVQSNFILGTLFEGSPMEELKRKGGTSLVKIDLPKALTYYRRVSII